MSNEVIDRTDATMNRIQSDMFLEGDGTYSEQTSKELISAAKIIVDKDGETLTYDKAKKMARRIELMKRLREDVLCLENLKEKMESTPRPTGLSVPPWYNPSGHDFYFLEAVAKWGVLRGDLILKDKELPFYEAHMNYLASENLLEEEGVKPEDLSPGKFEDRFWMREAPILKRIEYYCDMLAKKSAKRGAKRGKRRTLQWTPVDTESEMEEDTILQPTKLKLKLTVPKDLQDTEYKRLEKQERRKRKKEKREKSRLEEMGVNEVNYDTDAMLKDAESRLNRKDSIESLDPSPSSALASSSSFVGQEAPQEQEMQVEDSVPNSNGENGNADPSYLAPFSLESHPHKRPIEEEESHLLEKRAKLE